jgi:hypothetical protein
VESLPAADAPGAKPLPVLDGTPIAVNMTEDL